MNARDTIEKLKLMPNDISILLMAMHGVGKSSVVKQVAEAQNIGFYDVRLSQCEVGDIKGLPHLNHETKTTEFYKPRWWPRDMDSEGILFFDELNRAQPDVQQAVFEICLDRRLDGDPLPPGWRVVAAINATDDYQVTDLDPALFDRWFVIDFKPTMSEWVKWGREAGVHDAILEFVQQDGKRLDPPVGSIEPGKVYPSRRSWDRFNAAMNAFGYWDARNEAAIQQLASGFLGSEIAAAFPGWLVSQFEQIRPSDILSDYKKYEKKLLSLATEMDNIAAFSESFASHLGKRGALDAKEQENFKSFMRAVPKEIASKVWYVIVQIPHMKGFLKDCQKTDRDFINYMKTVYSAKSK
jgi:hypothetical protein